ncbi:uncharacterized protein ACMZJ9_004694 [Mantella aurantiaca]
MADNSHPTMLLNDGNKIPIIGFGTYAPEYIPVSLSEQATEVAIEVGFRHIDGAYLYQNEKEVGRAIQKKIADGTVKREDLFYTGKLWSTFHSPGLVEPNLRQSLETLQLDYMDLFLIHWPFSLKPGGGLFPMDENRKAQLDTSIDLCIIWEAMERCKDAGLVKSIGVSNFNRRQLEKILNKPGLKYKPVCNQVECHPYLNQKKLLEFSKSHDILLTAYSVLGSHRHKDWVDQNSPLLLEDLVLAEIGKKYNKTPANIAIRYQIQRGVVAITKSYNPERIKENFKVFDFELTPQDMKTIDGINRNLRYVDIPLLKLKPEERMVSCYVTSLSVAYQSQRLLRLKGNIWNKTLNSQKEFKPDQILVQLAMLTVTLALCNLETSILEGVQQEFTYTHFLSSLAHGPNREGVKVRIEYVAVKMSLAVEKDEGAQDEGTQLHQDTRLLLNDGHRMPVIALGTFTPDIIPENLIAENKMTSSVLETSDILDQSFTDEVKEAVKTSLDVGYRHIDCAYIYMTEKYIGQAFQEKFSEGNLKREDIFYTTKLWLTFHQPHLVRPAIERCLAALQMDYIDLFIIHHPISLKPGDDLFPSDEEGEPVFDIVDLRQTWEAMEQCKDDGLVKSIGLSNFNRQQLELILNKPDLKYKPVCNQVECHPYFTQKGMLEFCKSNDITLVAYGVLGSPTGARPAWLDPGCPNVLEDPVLISIGEKYQKSPAQVSIRYILQRGCAAIVKSFNAERIRQNFQVFNFKLSEEDMKAIDGLNKNLRYWKYKGWENHPNYHYDKVE